MLFKKSFLQDEGGVTISDEIVDHSRWRVHHERIFQTEDGRFYHTRYARGATESQDEYPYEYEPDEIECDEVKPVQKLITVYEKV